MAGPRSVNSRGEIPTPPLTALRKPGNQEAAWAFRALSVTTTDVQTVELFLRGPLARYSAVVEVLVVNAIPHQHLLLAQFDQPSVVREAKDLHRVRAFAQS